ncbi:hypothetical protein BJ878DRAFT_510156 [Calycina marina]|uniref:Uncharacterized protein n=1 Tax=Calycina marina TaxID=1763456 RepID=A0A9P8CEC9_9HELO|nr:hypothetical protein BJ878DRAFT_510156 [Calycina marina]
MGVDEVDPDGFLLLRIQTSFIVQNIAWVGKYMEGLWIVGIGGAARVSGWNLPRLILHVGVLSAGLPEKILYNKEYLWKSPFCVGLAKINAQLGCDNYV